MQKLHTQEKKVCPRCKQYSECNANDIAQCHCSSITLTDDQREYISGKYRDCLCHKCLELLQMRYNLFIEKEVVYKNR